VDLSNYTEILLSWYFKNNRTLPWRLTTDPYKIWLSEVILQQTRISQGLPYYEKFIKKFPTIIDLAKADEQEVLVQWQGLGYYSRARNLHKCAKILMSEYGGIFPDSYDGLLKLPGIGSYTAAAIASISYSENKPVLDGNVFRVLSRLFDVNKSIHTTSAKTYFYSLAKSLIPEKNPGDFNQALMEFGALQCLPKNPDCPICVLNAHCISFSKKNQQDRPVKQKKPEKINRFFVYLVLENDAGFYMKKREEKDIWKGLFDFFLLEYNVGKIDFKQVITENTIFNNKELTVNHIYAYKHILTHQIINASFYHIISKNSDLSMEILSKNGGKFYSYNQIEKLPKPVLIDNYLKEKIF
jgi:A/G-specific adenine glycosylase